jgi:hypothetical protein
MLLLAVVAAWAHTYSQTVFMTVLRLALRLQQRGTQGIPAKFRSLGLAQTNYTWLTGGGTNADYEIRWLIISTTPTTGVTGSWINMSVGETWTISTTFGIKSCQGAVQIRQVAAPNTILAAALVTLNAESEP